MDSGKTLYFVLTSRKVTRRRPNVSVHIQMRVIRSQDAPDGLAEKLYRSAVRGRGQALTFKFTWYKREKKRMTFEQYMRRKE